MSDVLQIEEENAALLAALTDSLDGMVDAEVGGLSVFPALGGEPDQEEEDEDSLSLCTEDFSQSLGAETEDPSLVRKPLMLSVDGALFLSFTIVIELTLSGETSDQNTHFHLP